MKRFLILGITLISSCATYAMLTKDFHRPASRCKTSETRLFFYKLRQSPEKWSDDENMIRLLRSIRRYKLWHYFLGVAPDLILRAVQVGDEDILWDMLEQGFNPNFVSSEGYLPNYTPLMCATQAGRSDMVTLLIEYGAQTTDFRRPLTALHVAAMSNDKATMAMLLDQRSCERTPAQRDWLGSLTDENMLVHVAAQHGSVHIIELLHRLGCDINQPAATTENVLSIQAGDTPLDCAVRARNHAGLKTLLVLGATPHKREALLTITKEA